MPKAKRLSAAAKNNPNQIKDFKKKKTKLGKKALPDNHTNTNVRSRKIFIPIQESVAGLEESTLASRGPVVDGKNVTLSDLLTKTNHHNAQIRKTSLLSITKLISSNIMQSTSWFSKILEKTLTLLEDTEQQVRSASLILLEKLVEIYDRQILWVHRSFLSIKLAATLSYVRPDIRLDGARASIIVAEFLDFSIIMNPFLDLLKNISPSGESRQVVLKLISSVLGRISDHKQEDQAESSYCTESVQRDVDGFKLSFYQELYYHRIHQAGHEKIFPSEFIHGVLTSLTKCLRDYGCATDALQTLESTTLLRDTVRSIEHVLKSMRYNMGNYRSETITTDMKLLLKCIKRYYPLPESPASASQATEQIRDDAQEIVENIAYFLAFSEIFGEMDRGSGEDSDQRDLRKSLLLNLSKFNIVTGSFSKFSLYVLLVWERANLETRRHVLRKWLENFSEQDTDTSDKYSTGSLNLLNVAFNHFHELTCGDEILIGKFVAVAEYLPRLVWEMMRSKASATELDAITGTMKNVFASNTLKSQNECQRNVLSYTIPFFNLNNKKKSPFSMLSPTSRQNFLGIMYFLQPYFSESYVSHLLDYSLQSADTDGAAGVLSMITSMKGLKMFEETVMLFIARVLICRNISLFGHASDLLSAVEMDGTQILELFSDNLERIDYASLVFILEVYMRYCGEKTQVSEQLVQLCCKLLTHVEKDSLCTLNLKRLFIMAPMTLPAICRKEPRNGLGNFFQDVIGDGELSVAEGTYFIEVLSDSNVGADAYLATSLLRSWIQHQK